MARSSLPRPACPTFWCLRRAAGDVVTRATDPKKRSSIGYLTDRVLPDVPVRQWVLSVPLELRFLLASNAQAFTGLTRIFMEETLAWYERSAAEHGIPKGRGAAVSVQHRFGGALNLNCHVHAAVISVCFPVVVPAFACHLAGKVRST
jgi:hypothetical protein